MTHHCPCCDAAADRQFTRMAALEAKLGGQSIDEVVAERDRLRSQVTALAEKWIKDRENWADEVSRTYFHMPADQLVPGDPLVPGDSSLMRVGRLVRMIDEVFDAFEDLVLFGCRYDGETYDSQGSPLHADGLRLLAKLGRAEIDEDRGHRVFAKRIGDG